LDLTGRPLAASLSQEFIGRSTSSSMRHREPPPPCPE